MSPPRTRNEDDPLPSISLRVDHKRTRLLIEDPEDDDIPALQTERSKPKKKRAPAKPRAAAKPNGRPTSPITKVLLDLDEGDLAEISNDILNWKRTGEDRTLVKPPASLLELVKGTITSRQNQLFRIAPERRFEARWAGYGKVVVRRLVDAPSSYRCAEIFREAQEDASFAWEKKRPAYVTISALEPMAFYCEGTGIGFKRNRLYFIPIKSGSYAAARFRYIFLDHNIKARVRTRS